jgi:hypothetical protein
MLNAINTVLYWLANHIVLDEEHIELVLNIWVGK